MWKSLPEACRAVSTYLNQHPQNSVVMTDRFVIVDDTISSINYIGDSWFADVGSQDAVDNGPPFLSTLHGTNTTASLAFNFTGSTVVVLGTNHLRNDSGVTDPQWSCRVDGVSIDSGSPLLNPENNWVFCSSYNLTDGPHTVTVNATVARRQTFWFDYLYYLPSKSVSLANKAIMLINVDSAIQYGTGWNNYTSIANWTQTQGASVTLNFYGTSLIWYGPVPGELNGNSTTATWVIDDNPAQNFTLKGHEVNATTVYNQKFFETPVYPVGSHKLTVTYNGDNSKTPLVLGRLVILNDTAVASTTGTGARATSSSAVTHASSNHTPAIVGGVIGGVACLLIVFSLVMLFLYRRRQKEKRINDEPAGDIPTPHVIPFNPPSRLPAKVTEEYSRSPNFRLAPGHTGSDPSGISSVETATQSLTTSNGQQPQNPSDSPESDSTIPSSLVVLQDSGVRLPRVMPPAYTPD